MSEESISPYTINNCVVGADKNTDANKSYFLVATKANSNKEFKVDRDTSRIRRVNINAIGGES